MRFRASAPIALSMLAAFAASPAQAATPTAQGADAAARSAVQAERGPGTNARALCNPERSARTGTQYRTRWACELEVSAAAEEYAQRATKGDVTSDPLPLVGTARVAWRNGRYKVLSIGRLDWEPRLAKTAPSLGASTARRLAWQAFVGEGFPRRSTLTTSDLSCKRASRSAFRCTLYWVAGDVWGRARMRIAMVRPRESNEWTYSWTMPIVNDYCRFGRNQPLAKCRRVDRVR